MVTGGRGGRGLQFGPRSEACLQVQGFALKAGDSLLAVVASMPLQAPVPTSSRPWCSCPSSPPLLSPLMPS